MASADGARNTAMGVFPSCHHHLYDAEVEKAALTIREGFVLYTGHDGRYPPGTAGSRSDILRAGEDCVAALGEAATWAGVIPSAAAQAI